MKNRVDYYRLMSTNNHLLDILNNEYFIELGAIDILVMSNLIQGKMIDLSKIIYTPLAVEGVGSLINSEVSDDFKIKVQLDYLNKLRINHTADRFFITIRTLHYQNDQGIDTIAPVALLPVEIDFANQKIAACGPAIANTIFLNYALKHLTNFNINTANFDAEKISKYLSEESNRFTKMNQVSELCDTLKNYLNVDISLVDFLTVCDTDYHELALYQNDQNNLFTKLHSLYSNTPEQISSYYFSHVNGILPVNNEQKYASYMADHGASFLVNGKLGSGKTHTIKNIIGDSLSKNKKVLYINQDVYQIDKLANDLAKMNLGKYIVNLVNEKTYPASTEHVKETKNIYDESKIAKMEQMNKGYSSFINGFNLMDIYSNLAYLNKEFPNIEPINIETELQRYEVMDIKKNLKEVVNKLQNIEEFKQNVWRNLLVHKNPEIIRDVHTKLELLEKYEESLCKKLEDYCNKFKIKLPDSISDVFNLYSEVFHFNSVLPNVNWLENSGYNDALDTLKEIEKVLNIYHGVENYYRDNINPQYKVLYIKKIIGKLTSDWFSPDLIISEEPSINKLLKETTQLDQLSQDIKRAEKNYNQSVNELCRIFDIKKDEIDDVNIITSITTLYQDIAVLKGWVKAYFVNRDNFMKSLNYHKAKYDEILKKRAFLSHYFKNEADYINFNHIQANLDTKKKSLRGLRPLIVTKNLKEDKLSYDELISKYENYYQDLRIFKQEICADELPHATIDEVFSEYLKFNEFLASLPKTEHKYFLNLINYTYIRNQSTIAECLKLLEHHQEIIKEILSLQEQLHEYNLNYVPNLNFSVLASMIFKTEKYLQEVIKCTREIKTIFVKNETPRVKLLKELYEQDLTYEDAKNNFIVNKQKYEKSLGDCYKGIDTDLNDCHLLLKQFRKFISRLIDKEEAYNLFSDEPFAALVLDTQIVNIINIKCSTALTSFSNLFYGGQIYLQSKSLASFDKYIKDMKKRYDELEPMVFILEFINHLSKYGLAETVELVKNNDSLVSERFYYSCLMKYRSRLEQNQIDNYSVSNLLDDLDEYNRYESSLCGYNLAHLIDLSRQIDLNSVERYVKSSYGLLYLADVSTFNYMDLSDYDLVLIDDAHLGNANSYWRIKECKQIILFGDISYFSSISNSVVLRVSDSSIVDFSHRYYPFSASYENSFGLNNQYIFKIAQPIVDIEVANYNEIASSLIKTYRDNPFNRIVIVDNSVFIRKQLYTSLLNELLNNFDEEKTLQILENNFSFTEVKHANIAYNDLLFVYGEKFTDEEMRLIWYNLTQIKTPPTLFHPQTADAKNLISTFKAHYEVTPFEAKGIVKAITQDLEANKKKVETGFGLIDLVVYGRKPLGIIINGLNNHPIKSYINEINYYYNAYRINGFKILILDIKALADTYDEVINLIMGELGSK